jgi:branched-chain amino acid transport system permease protein
VIVLSILTIILLQERQKGLAIDRRPVRTRSVDWASTLLRDVGALERRAPTPGPSLLEVREATKRFGGLVAVGGVSLDVKAGGSQRFWV